MLLKPEHNAASPQQGQPAVVTLPAVNLRGRRITGVDWGYDCPETRGSITIEDGPGNVVFGPMPIPYGGPGSFHWPKGMEGTPDTPMIITLAPGNSITKGCIKVHVEV